MSLVRSKGMIIAISLLLAGSFLVAGSAPVAVAAQTGTTSGLARTITVVGQGEVKAQPDIATSNIGVDVTAPTVVDAMNEAKTRMADILAAMKKLGIADSDIQTSNFSISYERPSVDTSVLPSKGSATASSDTQTSGVYHVSNMVQVTIRNLDQVGSILDEAVAAGANNVWGVSFGLDNTSALEATAREKAVADALSRATTLAELNGVSVGEVVAISEMVGNPINPVMYSVSSAKASGSGTSIEQGEITYSTQIQVVYAIK